MSREKQAPVKCGATGCPRNRVIGFFCAECMTSLKKLWEVQT